MPKQYLQLLGQPIAMHSLNTFGSMREVGEIVVVCDPSYRSAVYDVVSGLHCSLGQLKLKTESLSLLQGSLSAISGSSTTLSQTQLCFARHRKAR